MRREFGVQTFRGETFGHGIVAQLLHNLKQRVMIGGWPHESADNASNRGAFALISQRRGGLSVDRDGDFDDIGHGTSGGMSKVNARMLPRMRCHGGSSIALTWRISSRLGPPTAGHRARRARP
jgi:hypothetical protein